MPSIKNYLSLVTFSHTIFALPFACIGFFLGVNEVGLFYLSLFLKVIACMIFARSSAMAFNRLIDRKFDALNPRTAIREIPSGIINTKNALFFVIINSLLFVVTTWYINSICFFLSPIALFVILFYSYTKRFTPLCHLVLGAGLALAPIGAYLSVTGKFSWIPLFFSFAVFFWVSGFDIIYALQDETFDKTNQLKSIPVLVGTKNALIISRLLHFIAIIFLILAGLFGPFYSIYWVGVFFFSVLLIYQHTLVKVDDLSKINRAFFTSNGVASLLFAIFTIVSIFL